MYWCHIYRRIAELCAAFVNTTSTFPNLDQENLQLFFWLKPGKFHSVVTADTESGLCRCSLVKLSMNM